MPHRTGQLRKKPQHCSRQIPCPGLSHHCHLQDQWTQNHELRLDCRALQKC
jgi:hypothetical protein